jgi:hypothetical protein
VNPRQCVQRADVLGGRQLRIIHQFRLTIALFKSITQ